MFGRHDISGQIGGEDFQGHVEFRNGATYEGLRTYTNGTTQAIRGVLRIDEKALVLSAGGGAAGALGGLAGNADRALSPHSIPKPAARWSAPCATRPACCPA